MPIQSSTRRARSFAWCPALVLAVAAFQTGAAIAADASRDLWHATSARALPADAPQISLYRPLQLDVAGMRALLAQTRNGNAITLALPQPDGTFSEFRLADSRTMPRELQDKYPELVSLAGDDALGNKARVDITPMGFQAMVFDLDGVWVVRPETLGVGDRYMSFRRGDLAVPGQAFQCGVKGDQLDASGRSLLSSPAPMTTTGGIQRVYRAAVAANHNYVAAVCPGAGNQTVVCGLGAVVTAMNRVNQVYETELGVHMTLLANNNTIVYAPDNPVADPYSNNGNAIDQNQTNLDAVIGNANYDIGHVFTTGSGGVAQLRATCVTGLKAEGTTGLGNPTGDAFYIDYVAHEMGHQFGGNHTFNSTTSNCGGGNRAGSAAYEPGSGTTIMAYAGICGADNTQAHSDPYFHAKSLEEINTWLGGSGGACTVQTPSTDAPPVIDTASLPNNLTIPMHTPFTLTGSATDIDGDALTYNWEQYDLGPATTLAQGDIGSGPIFRSFNATTSGSRTFPKIESVLGAPLVKGEAWATTTRNLTFRLTVRDNHNVPAAPQYGATINANNIVIHVTNTAGPFAVTRPNTALTWGRGENHLVTWDVAGSNLSPVSCANVALDLSNDGGLTYAFPLAASVPNNGSTTVVVPPVPDTNQARVRASCVGNVFFDVSDVNFTIAATGTPDPTGPLASVSPPGFTFSLEAGTPGTDSLNVANGGDGASSLNYTITESADACATTTDVAWLSASPTSGTVVGGNSAGVGVNIDTDLLGAGAYSASLCVATNDPAHLQFVVPVALTVTAPANDSIFADGFDTGAVSCAPLQLFQDASFEATDPDTFENPFWTAEDSVAGTPYCDATCDTGGTIVARTGDWFVWFGGWNQANSSSLSQAVTFPNGQARWLNYWLTDQINGDPTSSFTLSIDGSQVLDITGGTGSSVYAAKTLEIPAQYLDGQSHTVRFDWSADSAAGEIGGAIVDDVTLDCSAQPTRPAPGPFASAARKHTR